VFDLYTLYHLIQFLKLNNLNIFANTQNSHGRALLCVIATPPDSINNGD